MALVARWEKERVPLDAVLEGMERAFANARKGGRPAGALTLALCEYQVAKAAAGSRERRAGATRKAPPREGKRARARREIGRFLREVPPGLEALAAPFAAGAAVLDDPEAGEDALETLDAEVEETLWSASPADRKEAVRREVRAGAPGMRAAGLEDVVRTTLVKEMRERHKVPYISPYYY